MINIYKASAGAGKTHKLTGEYIRLLFSKDEAYKHILAVTFTNKATDEMKQRILQELYVLQGTGHSDYLQMIMDSTGKDELWVRREAGNILVAILHDYTSFRVTTIDKFFQTVMRSFARELGRMATYNVELDKDSVLSMALDRMFSELDDPANRRLLEWLIEYSLDAVDKGDSWNIRNEILKLGGQLFSEDFKLARQASGNMDSAMSVEQVAAFKKILKDKVSHFERVIHNLASEGLQCIASASLELSDFKGGSRSPFNYLKNVVSSKGQVAPPGVSFIALQGDITKWYTGKKCPVEIEGVYGELNEIVGKIISHFDNEYVDYATSLAILSNVNVMGILNDLYARVMDYCKEKNIVLLSESTELLGRIIDGSDTPFIYEKIGTRLDNFMLDEFQDTSALQWQNFYPLLQNSLDSGQENLIVGDVKQSIYRWRGSDWNILDNRIYRQFRPDEIANHSLDCNYRSGENIVEFNNHFFDYCAKAAGQLYDNGEDDRTIERIYEGFAQQVSAKGKREPGYVEVDFISNEDDFTEQALNLLPYKVASLLEGGYAQKDIAVLVRRASEGNLVAEKLLESGYDIISSDSLYIASSAAVQKVVGVLRELDNPGSESLRIMRRFHNIPQVESVGEHSLYQLCETIIRESLDEAERNDVAFLQAFLDIVLDFTNNHGTNIAQFVKWWDETGVKCTISAPDDMDAIRIMTIHKSKGLGFNVVIIPFLKENLDHYSNMAPNLWCNSSDMPVPVRYGKGLLDTAFEKEYLNEKLCAYIDSLNTVYVAFTRPKRELIVFAQETKMNKSGYATPSTVADILFAYYLKYKDERGWDSAITIGESGTVASVGTVQSKLALANTFQQGIDMSRIRTVAQSGTIGDGESIREHGIAMHYVFSLVTDRESVEAAVEKACAEGVASCSREELLAMVTEKIESVKEFGWFDKGYEVLNECSILTGNGEEKRPDRVLVKGSEAIVIDYKFGIRLPGYRKQVSRYMDLLTAMGYTNVKGFLWYLSTGEIEHI